MFKQLLLATFSLILVAPALTGQVIEAIQTCGQVTDLEPGAPQTSFSVGDRAYLWMRVSAAPIGRQLQVEWIWNGQVQHRTKLDLPYSDMRTYCYKTLGMAGSWEILVRGDKGQILRQLQVTAGQTGTPPLATQAIPRSYEQPSPVILPDGPVAMQPKASQPGTPPTIVPTFRPPQQLPLAEGYSTRIEEPTQIVLPEGYRPGKAYPVLVFLPYTGGTAADLYYNYLDAAGRKDAFHTTETFMEQLFPDPAIRMRNTFIVLLPGGRGSVEDHSWQGFSACIYRYEQRIKDDLQVFARQYALDLDRVYLVGHSLGGDLSWAIGHRYPNLFSGAFVSGSRCSYYERGKMQEQAQNGFRYYLTLGEFERADRVQIFNDSKRLLIEHRVEFLYSQTRGVGHDPATFEQFREGLAFLMR